MAVHLSLLSLPLAIRIDILEYLLISSSRFDEHKHPVYIEVRSMKLLYFKDNIHGQILRVCQQFAIESSHVLYSRSHFVFTARLLTDLKAVTQ